MQRFVHIFTRIGSAMLSHVVRKQFQMKIPKSHTTCMDLTFLLAQIRNGCGGSSYRL